MTDELLFNLKELGKQLNSYLNIAQEEINSTIKECRKIQMDDNYRLEQMQAILSWQIDTNVHPLTCENCHDYMLPLIEDGVVILKCPTCNYVQNNIPTYVFHKYYDEKIKVEPDYVPNIDIDIKQCSVLKDVNTVTTDSSINIKK